MNRASFYKKLAIGITAAAVGYYAPLAPHTVLLDTYRKNIARYWIYDEIPVSETIQEAIKETMDDLKLQQDVRDLIKPFNVFGFDMFHAGTVQSKYGAVLGIPTNFDFMDVESIHKDSLKVNNEEIDWKRNDAQRVLKAFILSDNAKKFAIAREILDIQSNKPYRNSRSLSITVGLWYTIYSIFYYEWRLYEAKALYRRAIFCLSAVVALGAWIAYIDSANRKKDLQIDNALSELGPVYVEGGKEFYDQLLNRNAALRTLLGEFGDGKFTATGNEKYFIRQKSVPLSDRKNIFDKKFRELCVT